MGKMKELFTEYQNEMHGQDEFIDDDYLFQQWCESKVKEDSEYWESVASSSIFPDDMFYNDEYYKSTYHPTKEEEEAAFKLFNNQK
jgi:hypothetical protein